MRSQASLRKARVGLGRLSNQEETQHSTHRGWSERIARWLGEWFRDPRAFCRIPSHNRDARRLAAEPLEHRQLLSLTSGDFGFALNVGGSNDDVAYSVATDTAGNAYVTGSFQGTVDFGGTSLTSNGGKDIFVAKYSSTGTLGWVKSVGGATADEGRSIALGSDGSIYVTGTFTGGVDFDPGTGTQTLTAAGGDDVFVLKLNSSGDYSWAKRMGGTDDDKGTGIAVTSSGVFLTGTFEGDAYFNPGVEASKRTSAGGADVFVAKLNSADGSYAWAQAVGGIADETAGGLALTSDGTAVYATGGFGDLVDFNPGTGTDERWVNSHSCTDVFVWKLNASDGSYVSTQTFGGNYDDVGSGIAVASDGSIYLTGTFYGTANFDPGTGTTQLTTHGGEFDGDVFVVKLNANGSLGWAKGIGGTDGAMEDTVSGLVLSSDGSVCLTGTFTSNADFDPNAGTFSLDSGSMFVARLKATDGSFRSAQGFGGGSWDAVHGLAVASNGSIYTVGSFLGTADFDPSPETHSLTNSDDGNIFLTKFVSLTAPTSLTVSPLQLADGLAIGAFVGTFSTNGSSSAPFTYSFVSGTGSDDNSSFSIVGNQLRTNTSINQQTKSSYKIRVRTVDYAGQSMEQAFTLTVVTAQTFSVGNRVWNDLDSDGIQDANEPGIAGAAVELYRSTDTTVGNADDVSMGVVATGADGSYSFTYVLTGYNYYLVFRAPVGYNTVSPKDAGGNDTTDSDADASGVTAIFTGTAGQNNTSLDAGLVGAAQGFGFALGAGSAGQDEGQSVTVDAAGNVYVAGSFSGTVDFDSGPGTYNLTSAGSKDAFVAKYSSTGALLWARSMGGTSSDEATGIAVAADGSVYASGHFAGTADFCSGPGTAYLSTGSVYNHDAFVLKLDAAGNYVWAKSVGGAYEDQASGIALAADGSSVYLTGWFSGQVDFDPGTGTQSLTSAGGYDVFVLKLSSAGNYGWAAGMGGIDDDQAIGIAVDASGNVYTTGWFGGTAFFNPAGDTEESKLVNPGSGTFDVFVSKLDSNGVYVWAKRMGGTEEDQACGIALAPDGTAVYVAGYFGGSATFGTTPTLNSAGGYDGFVTKLDSDGDFDWSKKMGGGGYDAANSVAATSDGVYVGGYFSGTGTFGSLNRTSAGDDDAFVTKLSSTGTFAWVKTIGGTGNDQICSVAAAADGRVYTTGSFMGTADLDPRSSAYNLTSAGSRDFFLSKWNAPGITITPTSGLTTTENGGIATFTVVLNSQPTADVTISITSNDPTEGTVSVSSLTFTAANWNVPQTVTITGVLDALVDGNVAYKIVTGAATSTDPDYSGLNPVDVDVTNLDANYAPTDIGLSATSVLENRPSGTTVGTFTTTDPNGAGTFTYSLVSGTGSTDNAQFTIVGNELRTAASFNYETKSSYSIRVRTTDSGGLYYEEV
ncbi:MAG: SdrD B-like domain-containing protein, partial [Thermoguttaceae bacterium]